MRIGFDAKQAFYNTTGLGSYSRTLLNSLVRHFPENEHHLYTPGRPQQRMFIFPPQGSSFQISEPTKALHKAFPSLWRSIGLTSILKSDQLDLYHGLSSQLPIGIEKAGIKSLVTIHDLIYLTHPQFHSAVDVRIYKKKAAHSIRVADRVIAISEQTRSDILEIFQPDPAKVAVAYQACAPAFFVTASEQERQAVRKKHQLPGRYCLCVGRMNERKNQLSLLKSLALMDPAKRPHLVMTGGGREYWKKVRGDFIQQTSLGAWVHLPRNIPDDDLPAIYQQADAFIFPSLIEGFGIPILEALASGVPVITSNTGTWGREAGGPGTICVAPDDPRAIAEALLAVLAEIDLRKSMIKAGREHAAKFKEDDLAENMMRIYRELYDETPLRVSTNSPSVPHSR
jgi:glycosyltransferase involved in cell wall biosynthesis